ncbi:P-loop containing nucleoside triphosphate hydrolases superfamily protein [Euphorbia peplus]|nr:P-loop containing nucleoside triphosphate hydrolases superfamily protein [Euphorbia peplus]
MILAPQTMTEMWATMGSTIASFMFLWAIFQQYCPYDVRRYLEKYTQRMRSFFYPYIKISIHEHTGDGLRRSEAFSAVEAYLSVNCSKCAKRLKAEMGKDSNNLVLSMDEHERVTDEFQGIKVWWVSSKLVSPSHSMHTQQERRFYKLTFHKTHREFITEGYLQHVIREGKEIRVRNRQRKLFTNSPGFKWASLTMWSHIVFEHPATFETMALEQEKKQEIIEDLITFSKSKDFYSRIGKAWKRGYLLHGPPGTGKSTMIAAMANLLNYDVYDLELTAVKDNTELRKLLIETTSKSIIVIEDIDCSLDLAGKRKKKKEKSLEGDKLDKPDKETPRKELKEEGSCSKVTLSGLLNFIDGLWSACGGERLIVFTTNYADKLDPALIRRGRMDKHIELSYCSFEAFKVLARNYLKIDSHAMFDTIQGLMKETEITPADVAENLMPKSPLDNPDKCLSNLIQALAEAKEAQALSADKEKEANRGKAETGYETDDYPENADIPHLKENGEVGKLIVTLP